MSKNKPQVDGAQIDDAQFYSELLRAYFDSANDAIFVLCDEMKFLTCNKMTQQWLGLSEDTLTQHNRRIPITDLLGNPDSVDFFSHSFNKALNNEEVVIETRINPRNCKERWIELSMKRVDIENGDMVIVVARDISQRKKNIATIKHKTNYDQLTNLPNRDYLTKLVLTDKTAQDNKTESLTLISIDLDRFKEINESLGRQSGDIILRTIAQRLNKIIDRTSNELLARLEGDEFTFILPNPENDRANNIAAKIKNVISEPIDIGSNRISLDCGIGIANYPEHTRDKNQLIQYAESAMYAAKANKQGICFYNHDTNKTTTERLQLITDLRDALANDQITPNYQPIISMNKSDEIRVEALARWNHGSEGFISPEVFIPLAEEIGVINLLTSNIINRSIEECSSLLEQGLIQTLCINISAYYMNNPEVIDEIKQLLERYSIPAEQIVFEITESSMMANLAITEKIINELNQLGIKFSIDDFGTGYSSLYKLKELPLSELKIDKSFILGITDNENDAAIATASIQMAHALDLKVVAEGIEKKSSWDVLKMMGCDYGQGFWMGEAMPINELINWLKNDKTFD